MADSIEQKIITAIVARMQTILTANGFQTNIGAKVRDWETNWQQEDLPAISVFTGRTQPQESDPSKRSIMRIMSVTIAVNLERATTAANARIAIADIYQAIRAGNTEANRYLFEKWPVSTTPPGLAMWSREAGHQIQVPADSLEIIGAQVDLDIMYISSKFNTEA
jgi:hypothetical protein